ncbi:IQ motif EF-hand binding site [Arabidopsis thaliana x Arabidopsis arenosa]|uniref:IQ motif EF-hand binding site n=1 Tax=Arabidopsis thaliana x Arabidopsis arenosa TaxID=1240361 RepID=A0A8T1YT35_9BRAS|nr:IQ motif EF-hand binding site [Arabidopsis thaliana x Arabidopsis arenosa]
MGKKAKWFSSVKKAFSPDSKKSKQKLAEGQNGVISNSPVVDNVRQSSSSSPPPALPPREVRVAEVIVERNRDLSPPSTADAVNVRATDIPVVPSSSAPGVVRRATLARFAGKSNEEAAAILIQTIFRGYLARRALRAMRGLVRLKLLMEGSVVKRQAANTLKCMQTLSRVQSQIRARRIRMSEENQARQKQLLQKHAKELAGLKNGDNWNDSIQSKEKVEANLLSKYEATMRRERALAYAYSHQQNWKNNSKSGNPMFMDPSNPTWGWSWLERWMAGRPLESSEKEQNSNSNNDNAASVKGSINRNEAAKSITRNGSTQPNTPSSARGTPRNKNSFFSPPTPSRLIQSSRKSNDDDAKSTISVLSERNRRHSIAGSSVRDDESLAGSPALPSYMVPTKSARARLKPQSPSGGTTQENEGFTDKASAKKRLSYPTSPALPKPRRFSAPPKVESGGVAVTNGAGS